MVIAIKLIDLHKSGQRVAALSVQMFRRGGVDDICALLVSVAHEQQEPSSPSGPASSQAAIAALLPSLTAPGQMQDGSLQATGLDMEGAEQLSGQASSLRHASYMRSYIHSFVESIIQSFVCLFFQLFVCLFVRSFIHAFEPCLPQGFGTYSPA